MAKGKLLKKLQPMRKEEFSKQINPIISKTRKVDQASAKHQRFLRSDEVIIFLHKLGEDLEGYGKNLKIETQQMNKTKLKLLFPVLSTPEFSSCINEIICSKRDISINKAVHKRYLYPAEVISFLERIGEVFNVTADNG